MKSEFRQRHDVCRYLCNNSCIIFSNTTKKQKIEDWRCGKIGPFPQALSDRCEIFLIKKYCKLSLRSESYCIRVKDAMILRRHKSTLPQCLQRKSECIGFQSVSESKAVCFDDSLGTPSV